MFTDLRKSINSILYERVSSPFYGTLFFSWIVWNWKILYITFFISEAKFDETKIEYIAENCSDPKILIIYPIISTIVFLTIMPFISNGAYWLNLKFNNWKVEQKNVLEKKMLLTVEQSIQLREDLRNQENRFNQIMDDKNEEIKRLKLTLEELRSNIKENGESTINDYYSTDDKNNFELEYLELKSNEKVFKEFQKIGRRALNQSVMFTENNPPDKKIIDYFHSAGIIERIKPGYYKLTAKGMFFHNQMSKEDLFSRE